MNRELLASLGYLGDNEPPEVAVLRLHAEYRRALSLLAAVGGRGPRVDGDGGGDARDVGRRPAAGGALRVRAAALREGAAVTATYHPPCWAGLLPDPAPGEDRARLWPATGEWDGFAGLRHNPPGTDCDDAGWLLWGIFAEGIPDDTARGILLALGIDPGRVMHGSRLVCANWAAGAVRASRNRPFPEPAVPGITLEQVRAVTGRRRIR